MKHVHYTDIEAEIPDVDGVKDVGISIFVNHLF